MAKRGSSRAFPVGAYAKYKRATEFFLDWLLLARGQGQGQGARVAPSSHSSKLKLDALQGVVDKIVAEPTAFLTPAVLSDLPKALEACQCAITLRERVSQFFSDSPATSTTKAPSGKSAVETHQHFLERLKTWYSVLRKVGSRAENANDFVGGASNTGGGDASGGGNGVNPKPFQKVTSNNSSQRFANYYEVLKLDDDYFGANEDDDDEGEDENDDDEEEEEEEEDKENARVVADGTSRTPSAKKKNRKKKKPRKADRDAIFNEAFSQDLFFEVVSYLLELEDLAEGVHIAYDQVKKQVKTLVEATAVVTVAIECAKAATVRLQQRYPSIQTAQDLSVILTDNFPPGFRAKLNDNLANFYKGFAKNGYTFTPGVFISELIWMMNTLAGFTTAIPADGQTALILRDGFFGDAYSEETTPHYVLSELMTVSSLLMQQLPLIYNWHIDNKLISRKKASESLVGSFLAMMSEFFTTKKVTLPLVFATICWVKSVGCLQGDGGLGRNISLTIKHSWELLDRLERTLAKRVVHTADQEIHGILQTLRADVDQSKKGWLLVRANPLMAGFMMLDYHFKYLHVANETLLVTSRFRAFGHLYSALLDRELLSNIPFFDRILDLYETTMFTPSRAAATHGSFTRTYFVSSHMTEAAVDAMLRNEPQPRQAIKERNCLRLRDLSSIYRLVVENDTSVLGHEIKASSSKVLLAEVSSICSTELFDTRVLSRDMLRVNDDLGDLFSELCNDLRSEAPMLREYLSAGAPDDALAVPLMAILDGYSTSSRVMDRSVLPAFSGISASVGSDALVYLCKKAASAITKMFRLSAGDIDERYFLFPARPDFAKQEYGTASFTTWTNSEKRGEKFQKIIQRMEESDGPLDDFDLNWVKKKIKADPAVLERLTPISISRYMRTFRVVGTNLGTLLHHAAAGPAHDIRLVEWMIQMGALYLQPTIHCRNDPNPRIRLNMAKSELPDQMAIHSAAIAGHTDIVRLLLEADQFRDLNTTTFHGKESLVHLAVKHGHRELYEVLIGLGAKVHGTDANGKQLIDLTQDASWKWSIFAVTATQELSRDRRNALKNRDAEFQKLMETQADELRASLNKQRDQERQSKLPKLSVSSTSRPPDRKDSQSSAFSLDSLLEGMYAELTGISSQSSSSVSLDSLLEDMYTEFAEDDGQSSVSATSKTKKKKAGKKGSNPPAETQVQPLRASVNKQLDQETKSSVPEQSVSSTSRAPSHKDSQSSNLDLDSLLEETHAELTGIGSNSSVSTSKTKKKKRNKGKKGSKPPSDSRSVSSALPSASAIAESGDKDVETTPNILRDLLLGDQGAGAQDSRGEERTERKRLSVDQMALVFARLNSTTAVTVKTVEDVNEVCRAVLRTMKSVEIFAMRDRINSTGHLFKTDLVAEAMKTIHLMQKFHHCYHKAQVVPTFVPLKQLCATTEKFASFVVDASQIAGSIEQPDQAQELLDLLETRLLNLKPRPPWFRAVVEQYAMVRSELGLGEASSLGAECQLNWYLGPMVDDEAFQLKLDALCGFPIYTWMRCSSPPAVLLRLSEAIGRIPELSHVVYYNEYVIFGSNTRDKQLQTLTKAVETVKKVGASIYPDADTGVFCHDRLPFGGHIISADGIVIQEYE